MKPMVVPTFSLLRTWILWPWASTMCLQMESPSPLPETSLPRPSAVRKKRSKILFADAHTVVTDLDKDVFVIGIVHAGYYCATALAVFDGVVDKVIQYLPDLFLVGKNGEWLLTTFLK